LQKHYPTSALVTELVQIHQERFIVKAIVQVSGAAIATSMAESTTLETAEDQARLRVLDLLGISVIAGIPNLDAIPVPPPVAVPISGDRLPEIPSPEISSPEISSTEIELPIDQGFPIKALSSLDLEAIGVLPPLPLPGVPFPAISADLPMPFSTSLFSEEVATADEANTDEANTDEANTDEANTDEANTDEAVNDLVEEYLPSLEDYGAGYEDSEPEYPRPEDSLPEYPLPEDSLPEPVFLEDAFPKDPIIETETIAPISPAQLVQKDQQEEDHPVPLNSSKPKKAIAAETPVADPASNVNEPDDLSTLIAHTDIEMDRIGWTKQEGRDYLKRTYKKSTRQRLDLDELMDFLNYLRALPSVNGI
jgi:hypothetical protein